MYKITPVATPTDKPPNIAIGNLIDAHSFKNGLMYFQGIFILFPLMYRKMLCNVHTQMNALC